MLNCVQVFACVTRWDRTVHCVSREHANALAGPEWEVFTVTDVIPATGDYNASPPATPDAYVSITSKHSTSSICCAI